MPEWWWVLFFPFGTIGVLWYARSKRPTEEQRQAIRDKALATPVDAATLDRVRRHLAAEQKILAVKEIREATRLGLAESLALVEAIADGRQVTQVRSSPTGDLLPGAGVTGDPLPAARTGPDLAERVRQLQRSGREVDAIRLVCDETGMGILDAQKFVRSLG